MYKNLSPFKVYIDGAMPFSSFCNVLSAMAPEGLALTTSLASVPLTIMR
jgi:hypothetical protein